MGCGMALWDTAGGGRLVDMLRVQGCSALWAAGFQGCCQEELFPDRRTELLSPAGWVFIEPALESPRDGGAWWAASVESHRVGHD